MYCLREVQHEDLEELLSLSNVGITSLPTTKEALQKKIALSMDSFKRAYDSPGFAYYLFILEDLTTQKVVGTSAIRASAIHMPTFRKIIEKLPEAPYAPHPENAILLQLEPEEPDASELCGLVLAESMRSKGLGHLLSKGRFLYMADHLTHFHELLLSDLRGVISPSGHCPFWEGIGKPFCPLSFEEAEEYYRKNAPELFSLFPHHPIYLSLLPEEVQQVIGKTHEKSVRAQELLLKEGFILSDHIHPLDGGPRLEAHILDVRTIRESEIGLLSEESPKNWFTALVARTSSPYRACECEIEELPQGKVAIPKEAWKTLHASPGEHLRYIKVKG